MAVVSISLVCFGKLAVILCSGVSCQGLPYCTRPVAGQSPVPPGSAVYCCNLCVGVYMNINYRTIYLSSELDQHFVINLYTFCCSVLLLDRITMPLSGGAKAPNHPPMESPKRDNFDQFRITLFALTLSFPNLAWKYETSSQSKAFIGRHQISNYDVTFADVIPYVNCKILNLPIFHTVFERTIQGELKAEKILQYLKYELTYNILNLDKFGAQKWDYWYILRQ